MHVSHLANSFSSEPYTEKKKQNLEARTAEMEQRALKEITNLVEISQMVDLHRLLLEHREWWKGV